MHVHGTSQQGISNISKSESHFLQKRRVQNPKFHEKQYLRNDPNAF